MLHFVLAFALAALAPPAPAPEVAALPLARVTSVAAMGSQLVITCGPTTYLVEAATVRLDGDALVLDGAYSSLTTGPTGLKFESEYVDKDGITRRVVQTCGALSREACFKLFKEAEALMRAAYPEAPKG